MTTELLVTILIAIIGWIWAIAQIIANRKWQKQDYINHQRYEAYKSFMGKMDSIHETMREDPTKSVIMMTKEYMDSLLKSVLDGTVSDAETATRFFTNKLLDQVQKSCEPLLQIDGEINAIKLIASDVLLARIVELQALNKDLYNEMMIALDAVGKNRDTRLQNISSVGQQERWRRFESLYAEIRNIMRKEIGIR